MSVHELKTWPSFFNDLVRGYKTFEIRRNDREFHHGDALLLREWDPTKKIYTGRKLTFGIEYISDLELVGIPGFVAMSIRPIPMVEVGR